MGPDAYRLRLPGIRHQPLAVSRYRDRHNVGGAKSDPGDAKLLPDLVRTDRHNHRPVAGDSPGAEAVKVSVSPRHQNLIWALVEHTNRLRNALREYYPGALEAFDDLDDRDTIGVLTKAPTPRQGARLSVNQIRVALTKRGRQRNLERRATDIHGALRALNSSRRTPSPTRSGPPPPRSYESSVNSTAKSANSKPCSATVLDSTRTPTSTSPCQVSVKSSAPGYSQRSVTTRTATTPPSPAETGTATTATTPAPGWRQFKISGAAYSRTSAVKPLGLGPSTTATATPFMSSRLRDPHQLPDAARDVGHRPVGRAPPRRITRPSIGIDDNPARR